MIYCPWRKIYILGKKGALVKKENCTSLQRAHEEICLDRILLPSVRRSRSVSPNKFRHYRKAYKKKSKKSPFFSPSLSFTIKGLVWVRWHIVPLFTLNLEEKGNVMKTFCPWFAAKDDRCPERLLNNTECKIQQSRTEIPVGIIEFRFCPSHLAKKRKKRCDLVGVEKDCSLRKKSAKKKQHRIER